VAQVGDSGWIAPSPPAPFPLGERGEDFCLGLCCALKGDSSTFARRERGARGPPAVGRAVPDSREDKAFVSTDCNSFIIKRPLRAVVGRRGGKKCADGGPALNSNPRRSFQLPAMSVGETLGQNRPNPENGRALRIDSQSSANADIKHSSTRKES
jgi:hypothetical protein